MAEESRTAEVLVIGGGIIGLTIALRLRQQGVSVIVLERGEPGREASFAAAGMIAPKFEPETEPFARLAIASRDRYRSYCEELKSLTDIDAEYRDEGTVMPLLDDAEEGYASEILQAAGDSVPLQPLTREELLTLEPYLSPEVRRGIFIPGDHQVNNRKLMTALVSAVVKLGGVIRADTPVRAIRLRKGKVSHVETDGGDYSAQFVVLAAGCWSHQIAIDDPSLSPPTRPVKGQMVAVQIPSPARLTHNIHSPRCYIVPRLNGRAEIGSTVEEAGYDKTVTPEAVERLLAAARSVVPALSDSPVIETWAGLRPGSPDNHPIVGKTPAEGLIMATGNYRSGLLMAPITGDLITELILTGQTPPLLAPFSPERFYRGKE